MASTPEGHKELVREEFTRQATAYAANPTVTDRERVARLVQAVAPAPEARVLDVATGPGYVAMGFAAVCRDVVGLDLTAAPLEIAEGKRQDRGLSNLSFVVGDAERLPFALNAFDVVVCRLAFHHFEDPLAVLREMARVCRSGGTVAVEDLIASEHRARAAYHNRFENLRDPSHVRAIPLSELLGFFAAVGLEVQRVYTETNAQEAGRWLANAQTPPDRAREARDLIEQDEAHDLSGTSPFRRDGALWFTHRTAVVIGRKLAMPAP